MEARLAKLEQFFREIIDLTVNHDAITIEVLANGNDEGDSWAVVFPHKIADSLAKVDEEWWKR